MKRLGFGALLGLVLAWLPLTPVAAQITPVQLVLLQRPCAPGSTVDLEFVKGVYCTPSSVASNFAAVPGLTVTRASVGYAANSDGTLVLFQANQPRITNQGLLVEESRTNVVLWNRDLTNAAWVKSSATAALDQTGADGAANSASSITATAANATVLQSITLASSARAQSAYVKRLVGSGAISMTMDGGTTWTALTLTGSYAQVSIPTQTLANPSVGFKISTSGDKIAVDLVQNENGTNPTSPIPTTSASASRPGDTIVIAGLSLTGAYSFTSDFLLPAAPTFGGSLFAWAADDGTSANFVEAFYNKANGLIDGFQTVSNTTVTALALTGANLGAVNGFAFSANPSGSAASLNGGTVSSGTAQAVPSLSRLGLGKGAGASVGSLDGYILRIAIYPRALSNGELQAASGQ